MFLKNVSPKKTISEPDTQVPPATGLLLLQVLILLLFFAFVIRFWFLQIHKGQYFADKSLTNNLHTQTLSSARGILYDRNGEPLAINVPSYTLNIIREDVKDIEATLKKVSEWTDTDLEEVKKRYLKGKKRVKKFAPLMLVSDLPFEKVAQIETAMLFWPGLVIRTQSKRYYPYPAATAHILGYVAQANENDLTKNNYLEPGEHIGKNGLELVLEKKLQGSKGLLELEKDARGRVLKTNMKKEPVPGQDIILSLDLGLQQHIIKHMQGQAGSIIVMEPETGRLLAYVSLPAYNTNAFITGHTTKEWSSLQKNPLSPLQNRGIQSMFPPGSVYKLMIAGAILEDGTDPKETVTCHGQIKFGNRIFRCWKKYGHGKVDFKEALMHSCDVYFYEMGNRLGVKKMSDFALKSGFGKQTGIILPYEKAGLVPTPEWKKKRFSRPWVGGDNLNMAIGQGFNLVTPMQVAQFVSALVNGGTTRKPLILKNSESQAMGRLPLQENHRKLILQSMVETVEKGTARILYRPDIEIGGKTGTAQVVGLKLKKGDERRTKEEMAYFERDHAWLATYAIKDNKKYVAIGIVEHGGKGGAVTGPILKAIYAYLFPYEKKPEAGDGI